MRIAGRVIAQAAASECTGAVIVEDGLIAAIQPGSRLDAEAPVILPGFIDAHTHPLEAGLDELYPNLAGVSSIDGVLSALSGRLAFGRDAGVMLAFNLEPDDLAEQRYPTRAELDRVTGAIPTLVYRVDGHSAALNTTGFAVISDAPNDGLEHGPGGQPTGVVRGPAYEFASRAFKRRLRPDTVRAALLLAGEQAVRQGITSLGAFVGNDDLDAQAWQVLVDGLASTAARAVPYLQTWNCDWARRFGLRQTGGCLLIDGSFGSRTAALEEDYADAPGNRGSCYVADDKLLAFYRAAETQGLQTAVHSIGDRAIAQVLRCMQTAGVSGRNHRIEHVELLNAGLIDSIARLGVLLGVQPAFERAWGGPTRMYSRRLGERWHRTNPFRELLARGVLLAGGSDAPITPMNPLAGIQAAIQHPNTEQRIRPGQALAMFTASAARALQLDREVGTLEPGKRADIVVLTADPRSTADCRVVATFRGGTCAYKDDTLTSYLRLEN
jgi:predicted amidohydrolase YtcJ